MCSPYACPRAIFELEVSTVDKNNRSPIGDAGGPSGEYLYIDIQLHSMVKRKYRPMTGSDSKFSNAGGQKNGRLRSPWRKSKYSFDVSFNADHNGRIKYYLVELVSSDFQVQNLHNGRRE